VTARVAADAAALRRLDPIDAIMAAVRLMRAEDKRAAGDNAP